MVELTLDHAHDNEVARVSDRGERFTQRVELFNWWGDKHSAVWKGRESGLMDRFALGFGITFFIPKTGGIDAVLSECPGHTRDSLSWKTLQLYFPTEAAAADLPRSRVGRRSTRNP